jgi:hypothetical protein
MKAISLDEVHPIEEVCIGVDMDLLSISLSLAQSVEHVRSAVGGGILDATPS